MNGEVLTDVHASSRDVMGFIMDITEPTEQNLSHLVQGAKYIFQFVVEVSVEQIITVFPDQAEKVIFDLSQNTELTIENWYRTKTYIDALGGLGSEYTQTLLRQCLATPSETDQYELSMLAASYADNDTARFYLFNNFLPNVRNPDHPLNFPMSTYALTVFAERPKIQTITFKTIEELYAEGLLDPRAISEILETISERKSPDSKDFVAMIANTAQIPGVIAEAKAAYAHLITEEDQEEAQKLADWLLERTEALLETGRVSFAEHHPLAKLEKRLRALGFEEECVEFCSAYNSPSITLV